MFGENDMGNGASDGVVVDAIAAETSAPPAETPTKQNKSQAIRDYRAANPGLSSEAVVAGLASQGIEVRKALVDNVVWYDRRQAEKKAKPQGAKKGTKKAAKKAAVKKAPAKAFATPLQPMSMSVDLDGLRKFRKVVNSLGGITVVKRLLAILEELSV